MNPFPVSQLSRGAHQRMDFVSGTKNKVGLYFSWEVGGAEFCTCICCVCGALACVYCVFYV